MKKTGKLLALALVVLVVYQLGVTLKNKHTLSRDVIRLHVVADSDAAEDQRLKLFVRDAVLRELETVGQCAGAGDARQYLSGLLEQLQTRANAVLAEAGSTDTAVVTLCREAFPVRQYDTFSLPSGVYESLRVTIGSGRGQNWWCVIFPTLCIPATTAEFEDTAVGAGFSDTLTGTLSGEDGYEISFFLLDCIGKLENFFHFR